MCRGRRLSGLWVSSLFALTVASSGCGSDDEIPAPPKPCPYTLDGQCVGVPVAPVCGDPTCTGSVACSSVVTVSDASALAGAAASASSGTCLALAPGSYGAVVLGAGVSLLGRGADFVTVQGIEATAATGATVRGVTVGAGGVAIHGAGAFTVDAVRVGGATGDGITADGGVELSVRDSEVLSAAGVALRADGAAGVAVESFVVDGTAGPGVAVLCADGCACTATASIERTLVRDASHVGMFLRGVAATLDAVDIGGTQVDGLEPSSGGGLVVAGCADVTASHMNVHDNAFFGILVDSAAAHLGSPGEENGIIIHANVLGVWFQGDAGGEVGGADISANQGVGLGASGQTKGIIIHASQIRDTTKKVLVVFGGGSEEVGDGLLWTDGAQVEVDDLVLSNSARQPVLIDGAVAPGSSIAHLTLEGSDAGKSILQQNLPTGGLSPALGAGAPAIDAQAAAVLPVPVAPVAPATP